VLVFQPDSFAAVLQHSDLLCHCNSALNSDRILGISDTQFCGSPSADLFQKLSLPIKTLFNLKENKK
jgi:hypothetical protein